jgi:hypothetical protein
MKINLSGLTSGATAFATSTAKVVTGTARVAGKVANGTASVVSKTAGVAGSAIIGTATVAGHVARFFTPQGKKSAAAAAATGVIAQKFVNVYSLELARILVRRQVGSEFFTAILMPTLGKAIAAGLVTTVPAASVLALVTAINTAQLTLKLGNMGAEAVKQHYVRKAEEKAKIAEENATAEEIKAMMDELPQDVINALGGISEEEMKKIMNKILEEEGFGILENPETTA